MEQFIQFVESNPWVFFVPTFLFIAIVLVGTLVGFIRGFRSSIFRFVIMIFAVIFAIIFFTIIVSDGGKVFYNSLLAIGINLEEKLGVSVSNPNMLSVLEEYILKLVAEKAGGYDQIAIEIYPQIAVWAEMSLRFCAFLVSLVCYLIVLFILNVFYFIFFREGKYKKKTISRNKVYKKHRILGGGVGLVRGLITGLVTFSFLGWILFSVTGGREENDEVKFTDPELSEIYDMNNMVKTFGNTGIFKLLNNYKNSDNVPFYLFFADAVISGKTTDYNGDEYRVNGSNELGSIAGIANDLLDLLGKYGGEELTIAIVSGKDPDAALKLMEKLFDNENFNLELEAIIDNYQSTEYLKNMTKIAISSVTKNFELVVNNLNLENKELANNILGFYDAMFGDVDSNDYLAPADIVTFDDAKLLLKSVINSAPEVIDILNYTVENKSENDKLSFYVNTTNLGLEAFSTFYSGVENMSFWNGNADKSKKMNGIISRGINYAFSIAIDKNNIEYENPFEGQEFDWINEINAVDDTFSSITGLTNLMVLEEKNSGSMAKAIENVFSENYSKKQEVDANFSVMVDNVNKYESVNVLFNSDFIYGYLETTLEKFYKVEEIVIPRDINWTDEVVDGALVPGELRILLNSLRVACSKGIIQYISPGVDYKDINVIKGITNIMNSSYDNNQSLLEYLLESKIIYYGCSISMQNVNLSSFEIITPDLACANNGMIKKEEIKNIFNSASIILNKIDSLDIFTEDPTKVIELLKDEEVKSSINKSDVLVATASNYIVKATKNNEDLGKYITIPARYDYSIEGVDMNIIYEAWKPEFSNILNSLEYFDINKLVSNDPNYIVELLNIEEEKLDVILLSNIIWCSVGNILENMDLGELSFVIPNTVEESFDDITVITKNEIKNVFNAAAKVIYVKDNSLAYNLDAITENKDTMLKTDIIHATVINYFLNLSNNGANEYIKIPEYLSECDFENFENSNWYGNSINEYEVYKIITAIDELEIKLSSFENVDASQLINKILLFDLPAKEDNSMSKIEIISKSKVISLTMSYNLLNNKDLEGKIFVPNTALSQESTETEKYIKASEWKNLVSAMKKSFDISIEDDILSKFSDINGLIRNVFIANYEEKRDSLLTSYILENTLVKQVELNLKNNDTIIIPNVLNNTLSGPYSWYASRNEFDEIIEEGEIGHLLDIFNVTELGAKFGKDDFQEELSKTFEVSNIFYSAGDSDEIKMKKDLLKEAILKSIILNSTLINQIISITDNDGKQALNIPSRLNVTKEEIILNYDTDFNWVVDEEINNIFVALNSLELPIVGNTIVVDADSIIKRDDYENIIDSIALSKIIYFTIGERVRNVTEDNLCYLDEVILPIGVNYQEKTIDKEEFKLLVSFAQKLGIDNFGSFSIDAEQIFDNKDSLLSSLVIQSSVSNEIIKASNNSVNINNSSLLESEKVYSEYHINGSKTQVLSKEEIINFLTAIKIVAGQSTLEGFEFNIDGMSLLNLTDEQIYHLTKSQISRAIVSNLLLGEYTIMGFKVSGRDVYNSEYQSFKINLASLGAAYDDYVFEYGIDYKLVELEKAKFDVLRFESNLVILDTLETEYLNQAQIIALKQMLKSKF